MPKVLGLLSSGTNISARRIINLDMRTIYWMQIPDDYVQWACEYTKSRGLKSWTLQLAWPNGVVCKECTILWSICGQRP